MRQPISRTTERLTIIRLNDYDAPAFPQALVDVLEKWLPNEPVAATKQATGKPG